MKLQLSLFIALAFLLIVIPNISAFEFDNIKEYDQLRNEITFKNSFLGIPTSTIAVAKLDTPQINYVMPGKDRLVAEFTITSYEEYTNIIKEMQLVNLKNGQDISRTITYKYKESYYVDIPTYIEECKEVLIKNETGESNPTICTKIEKGTHQEIRYRYIPLEKMDLKIETMTIGIFTDVYEGDNVEWYPTMFGQKVTEWAIWTAALNVGLVSYYDFNNNTGNLIDKVAGKYNLTQSGTVPSQNGILNNSRGNYTTSDYFSNTYANSPSNFDVNNFTISFWVNISQIIPDWHGVIGNMNVAQMKDQGWGFSQYDPNMNWSFRFKNQTAGKDIEYPLASLGRWMNFVVVRAGTNISLYVNGTIFNSFITSIGSNYSSNASYGLHIGSLRGYSDDKFFNGNIDEVGIWNRSLSASEINDLYNGGSGLPYLNNIGINLDSPTNNKRFYNNNITFNATISAGVGVLVNASLWDNSTGVWKRNQTQTRTGISNVTTFYNRLPNQQILWTIEVCSSGAACAFGENRTVDVNSNYVDVTSTSYNTTSYETAQETFIIAGDNLQNAILVYNGTSYATTTANNVSTVTIAIPASSGNKSFYWTMNNAADTSSTYYQNVLSTVLTLCNSTINVPYLNITFKDELTSASLNGTINPLSIQYYLGDGSVTKTYSLTNSTENSVYSLCLTPTHRTVDTQLSLTTSSTGYPIRYYAKNQNLTNATSVDIVYLLSSADGLYQPVVVTTSNGVPLSGATVSASSIIVGLVEERTTDSNGQVSLWLSGDTAYTLTTSKSGYPSDVRVVNPSTTAIQIVLGTETTVTNTTNCSSRGIDYTTTPLAISLVNDTTYSFGYILTSSYWDVNDYGFSLRLKNGTIMSGGNTGTEGTQLSLSYNTNNQTIIYSDYYYRINECYFNGTRIWIIDNTEYTGWSINFLFTDLTMYINSGLFGLDEFGRYLIIFIIIFMIAGFMSYKYSLTSPIAIVSIIFGTIFFFDIFTNLLPNIVVFKREIENGLTYIAALVLVLVIFKEVKQ